jgi:3-hydroxyacyl-CoA dehydrogenase
VARHAGAVMTPRSASGCEPPPPMTALEGTGLLGRKGGRGFYRLRGRPREGRQRGRLRRTARPAVPRRTAELAEQEILDRTLLAMVNEAARVLEDGIVATPGDVDLA